MLVLQGWAYCPSARIKNLNIVFGDELFPVATHSWARTDVLALQHPQNDPKGHSLFSGFWALLPISVPAVESLCKLKIQAITIDGEVIEREVKDIRLIPGSARQPIEVEWTGGGTRVAICMAAYNPPINLFKRQVNSLKAQTHENWVCVITDDQSPIDKFREMEAFLADDPRFRLVRNSVRLGFYHNFERSMSLTPLDAEFVALCDQDDKWDDDKLETLIESFDDKTALIYSDARITDADGSIISDTFWHNRRNNYKNLPSLVVANTITGAASMFRSSLLNKMLPFPQRVGDAYHDHWIGLIAYLSGGVGYIDRPLYDYVQHGENVIGHNYGQGAPGVAKYSFEVIRRLHNLKKAYEALKIVVNHGVMNYQYLIRTVYICRMLMIRVPDINSGDLRIIKRLSEYHMSVFGALKEKSYALLQRRPTLNLEGLLLYTAVTTRGLNLYHRVRQGRLARSLPSLTIGSPSSHEATSSASPAPAHLQSPDGDLMSKLDAAEIPEIKWVFHNTLPLRVDASEKHSLRVNMLLGMIDFRYVFGGYLGMFNLALRLSKEGHKVRIILLERSDFTPAAWREEIRKYPGVANLFDEVEVIHRFDRSDPVEMNPRDSFIATNGWNAHVAHTTLKALGRERFMFMVQDYELFFLPMNTISALFMQSYRFPQFQLFSTELLRDYFRDQRLGVFGRHGGEENSAVFSNAVQRFNPTREDLSRRNRKLVFYARPEAHAARNLFELGVKSLCELARNSSVDLTDWSFYGMGSIGDVSSLSLAPGVDLKMLPKTGLDEYARNLPRHDVGLSLMLTPHPSLVPLEMAGAGMWTVTNTFGNKTVERLKDISPNLIGVEPTVDGIQQGLIEAISRVNDIDSRLAGSKINWPTNWDDAFPPEDMAKVLKFLADG